MGCKCLGSVLLLCASSALLGQGRVQQMQATAEQGASQTMRTTSRAVLLDVIVFDSHGNPVKGLNRDAFIVTEQGKPQAISFFEENVNRPPAQAVEMPKLPPNVFSNFSPLPQPPAVNVLLLDSLNTRMESQSFVHTQALKFLKSAKSGTRSAIFTMGLGLHFIQGFNDDPAVLATALNDKKNNWVETSVMLKGPDESNAQQNVVAMMSEPVGNGQTAASPEMIAALQKFINENDNAGSVDRMYVTLANLQRLAAFLEGFGGRKNIIWFTESVPSDFLVGGDTGSPAVDNEIKKTVAVLAAARAAIYPVDARGTSNYALYTAENNMPHNSAPSQIIGTQGYVSQSRNSEAAVRNADQESAKLLAEQSGGRAFANTNSLADVIEKVTSNSAHFYTLSYSPSNNKMDGSFRKIEIKVAGGDYKLSYRRGYYAVDEGLPGSAMTLRNEKVEKLAAQDPKGIDPLLPFMDLGMPQSEQILYKIRMVPEPSAAAATKNEKTRYTVDFAIGLKDLDLKLDADGVHQGALNVSLIVYDRYGNIISREDHLAQLNIKPNVYAMFQQAGVQLHAELAVPKGNYWLRTGVYDQRSRKVGTMEFPLSRVEPVQAAGQ